MDKPFVCNVMLSCGIFSKGRRTTMYKANFLKSAALFVFVAALCVAGAAQADVGRRTTAITYPLGDTVDVQFRGTTRFPRMKGTASVERTTRKGTLVKLHVENMPRPFELGPGYATYVVWAISPEGQADNLGEIKRSGLSFIDSKIEVTTPLQTFSIIITAEPHFLVTRPSQQIMLENLAPSSARNGKAIQTVPAVQYFGNSSDYFRDPRTPEIAEIDYQRTPPSILQANQAIALARFAGAERDAPDELNQAVVLSQNATNAWQAGRDSDTVDIAARNAISAAVKAESLSAERRAAREKRNEKIRTDNDIRAAEDKYTSALQQIDDLKADLAREQRERELAQRDVANLTTQNKDLQAENSRLSQELGKTKTELDAAMQKVAAVENEKAAVASEKDKQLKDAQLKANEPQLLTSLKALGSVAKNERGIVLTLPETLWTGARSTTFVPQADGKLTLLSEILNGNPDYRITIESHTDNSGDPSQIQTLTDKRSYAIADRLAALGVTEGRIVAKGYGASIPVVPNTTVANRAKNRRLLVILSLPTDTQ
ncbi:MAG: OmpA family protein [Acidobacteria bacterium]|nr:OmpA family protein [Acidobacteriota bacterium]